MCILSISTYFERQENLHVSMGLSVPTETHTKDSSSQTTSITMDWHSGQSQHTCFMLSHKFSQRLKWAGINSTYVLRTSNKEPAPLASHRNEGRIPVGSLLHNVMFSCTSYIPFMLLCSRHSMIHVLANNCLTCSIILLLFVTHAKP